MNNKSKGKKKLNRKGFTLIELLAVIAVLALIFSVAVYSITSIIKNARQKTYDTTINEIEKAAGNYAIEAGKDINFVTYPADKNLEYRCVKVQSLIDYGFLDNNVTKSLVADDTPVSVDSFVYLVRNPKNKTIVKKQYVTADNAICVNNQYITGSVLIDSSPDADTWAKQKTITIDYKVSGDLSDKNYKYSYWYYNSITEKIEKSDDDLKTNQAEFVVSAPGNVSGTITDGDTGQVIDSKPFVVTKIDNDGPIISEVNNAVQYVEKSANVKFKVADCEDNYCSGLENITDTNKLNDLIKNGKIKVGIKTSTNKIEYLAADNVKLSKVSGNNYTNTYNLKIDNEIYNGEVVITFEEGTFSDNVGNTNNPKELKPNIIFDAVPLEVEVNNVLDAFVVSINATLVCKDNNKGMKYYFGDTQPTSSKYVSIENTYDSNLGKYILSKKVTISQAKKYYFSCKDAGGETKTIELDYWNYTVKGLLNTPDGEEGNYTTTNYEQKREARYLGVDGMFIPFSMLLDENDEAKTFISSGSNIINYKGYSTGEPSNSKSASPVYNDAILKSNITYCLWFDRNKVNISYNTNGGQLMSDSDKFTAYDDGNIFKDGTDVIQTIKYEGRIGGNGLVNWNNPDYINIEKSGYVANDNQWICKSGCSVANKTFNQGLKTYEAIDFCDARDSDCYVTLGVNWRGKEYRVNYNLNGGIAEPSVYSKAYGYSDPVTIPNLTKTLVFNPMPNDALLRSNCNNPQSQYKTYSLTYTWSVDGIQQNLVSPVSRLTETDRGSVNIAATWNNSGTNQLTLPTVTMDGCTCAWGTENATYTAEFESGGVYNKPINYNEGSNGAIVIDIYPVCWQNPTPPSQHDTILDDRCYYNSTDTNDSRNKNYYHITYCDKESVENAKCIYDSVNLVSQVGTVPRKNLNPKDSSYCTYTIKYDCKTNGGSTDNSEVSYKYSNTPNPSSKSCTKSGWTFVGWNTDKNAKVGLSSISKGPKTLYGIYKKDITVTFNDEGYGLAVPHQINVSSYTDVRFSCNNNKCTSTCTLYNKDTSCRLITPHIVFSEKDSNKNFFSNRTDDYTAWNNSGAPAGFERVYAHSPGIISDSASKTYYVPHDNKNATRYNCANYQDNDGTWRWRMKRLFITTCDGLNCNYTKLNGLSENGIEERAGLRDSISGSGMEKCGEEYYLNENANCYPQTKATGNPSTTIKSSDCKKLTVYRTTTKITSDGANSWYYYPAKDCYIEGTKLRGSAPSSCSPPPSSSSSSSSSSTNGNYYVLIEGGGAICNNSSYCQDTNSYQVLKLTYTNSISISTVANILHKGNCTLADVGGKTQFLDWQENGWKLTAHWNCTNGLWCYTCNEYYGYVKRNYDPNGYIPKNCKLVHNWSC